jgi:uncharacterized protein (DUF58 family)
MLVCGVGVLVAARTFSVVELFVAGVALIALPLVALVLVGGSRLRMRVRRTINPSRVHAGDVTRVELAVANSGTGHTPTLTLTDPVAGTRGAALSLGPLRPRSSARAAYRLPTAHRGVIAVGPLRMSIEDPFGLARRQVVAAPVLELTVLPHVDRISLPLPGGDRDPHGGTARVNELARRGEEFYGLRPYVVGDDLRHVHWKSSARTGELFVKQVENPRQDRTIVLVDSRRDSHRDDSFERAASAAASVATAAFGHRHLLRLVGTDGTDTGLGTGLAHVDGVLEYLATVELRNSGSLRVLIDQVSRTGAGGLVVAVLGRPTNVELDSLARLGRAGAKVVAVVCDGPLTVATPPPGLSIVDATEGNFVEAWDRGLSRAANRLVTATNATAAAGRATRGVGVAP